MPGYSPSDNNIVDGVNTTTVLLAPLAEFIGTFVDVTGYSSVSFSTTSDVPSTFSGIQIEWSTDGITADIAPQKFTFDPFTESQDGLLVHVTVRAPFYRLRYKNGVTGQTSFVLVALLRKGSPSGTVRSIDHVNTFTTNLDVQEVQAILSGVGRANNEQVLLSMLDDVNSPNDGPFLFVSPRPGKVDNVFRRTITATLTPTKLTNTFATLERNTFLSITNDVLRGNLFIQLNTGTGLSATQWDFIIPPGHTWQDPGNFGSVYPGDIYGVWDEVYIQSPTIQEGHARVVSHYYG